MKASAKLFCGSPEEVTPKYRNTVLIVLMLGTMYLGSMIFLVLFNLILRKYEWKIELMENTLNFV